MPQDSRKQQGDTTRDALIKTATRVFAELGYYGASTRAIAKAADVNQALIGYHFGGKKDLYQAVFVAIAEALEQRMTDRLEQLKALLAEPDPSREDCLAAMETFCGGLVELMLQPETEYWSQLILREQQHPGPAFDILYERFMSRVLGITTRLAGHLRPELESEEVKLLVITVLGQILVWRFARTGIQRQMGWNNPDIEAIKHRVFTNIRLLLAKEPFE
ncbi:TetR family transcriptional regulator [Marinobacter santoriniensis NKSG1]|uniref:TetR family transcriptional regulator n=1 Tax=Marinobacter santoriniensis NKSG1 TaxID=1288826 RepID=M7DI42_9GAMM|nr:CerR family C-terminal domain-containing protein [Marinobacter santoriniensis]EMP57342.1 TetR family transcriptional regulator [Marinobacter santoriniensis NKSG1]